jgi:hypothetical protein
MFRVLAAKNVPQEAELVFVLRPQFLTYQGFFVIGVIVQYKGKGHEGVFFHVLQHQLFVGVYQRFRHAGAAQEYKGENE